MVFVSNNDRWHQPFVRFRWISIPLLDITRTNRSVLFQRHPSCQLPRSSPPRIPATVLVRLIFSAAHVELFSPKRCHQDHTGTLRSLSCPVQVWPLDPTWWREKSKPILSIKDVNWVPLPTHNSHEKPALRKRGQPSKSRQHLTLVDITPTISLWFEVTAI